MMDKMENGIDVRVQVQRLWELSSSMLFSAQTEKERNQPIGRISALHDVLNIIDLKEQEDSENGKGKIRVPSVTGHTGSG